MNQMVGGTAGGQQGDHGIHDATLIHHLTDGPALACARDVQNGSHCLARQLCAHRFPWVDEGRAGHMQAHGFEQHLVAVGRAVKSAGAFAMVGLAFRGQQFIARDQALHRTLSNACLLFVGQAGGHRPCWHKDRGQMAKVQGPNQQARHNFVAHPEHQGRVKHIVAQRHGRGHGDHIAAEQTQLHARLALGDAIAHGRHPTRHLGGGAAAACLVFDHLRVKAKRRMRRQHVVVGVDDADVGRFLSHHFEFV